MPEVVTTTALAESNPTPAPPPPASYTAPSAAPRPGAITDDAFRRLAPGEQSKFVNVRGGWDSARLDPSTGREG
jgi:hypothetical protein